MTVRVPFAVIEIVYGSTGKVSTLFSDIAMMRLQNLRALKRMNCQESFFTMRYFEENNKNGWKYILRLRREKIKRQIYRLFNRN